MGRNIFGYSLFGLDIRSEIRLPGVPEAAPAGDQILIREQALPPGLPTSPGYAATDQGTVLTVPRVGRYLIQDGRCILVERQPDASDRNVRLFLLGSAFGALLHQRGLLPLHANAIDVGGRVVAFSGHSGAGKSTIAAWFHDRGYKVLADDVCVIAFEAGGAVAYPGLPRLRLWREALEASGRVADDYDLSFDDMTKYDVPTRSRSETGPLPLDHVYLLRRSPEAGAASISRLRGVDAVDALVSNTYRGAYLRSIGRTRDHLMTCARLAAEVPVYSAERVWGFDNFEQQARLLERHVLDIAEAAERASARRNR
ncbi:MAG: hypothetical protein ACXWUR_06890 [Allosphingosinicella sp.]